MAKSNPSGPPVVDGSSKLSSTSTSSSEDNFEEASAEDIIYGLAWISVCAYSIYRIIFYSYRIRMSAIDEYGPVIHEFDPYFNYRATEVRKQRDAKRNRREENKRFVFIGNDCKIFPSRASISSFPPLFSFFFSTFMSTARLNFSSGSITWSGTLWDDP